MSKPALHQNNPMWIGNDGTVNPRTLGKSKNYTHRMEFHAESGTRDWLKQYEVKPTNEPGRHAAPADKIDEFNRRVKKVVIRR